MILLLLNSKIFPNDFSTPNIIGPSVEKIWELVDFLFRLMILIAFCIIILSGSLFHLYWQCQCPIYYIFYPSITSIWRVLNRKNCFLNRATFVYVLFFRKLELSLFPDQTLTHNFYSCIIFRIRYVSHDIT